MNQQIRITIDTEANATLNKSEIKQLVEKLFETQCIVDVIDIKIEEEAEIYKVNEEFRFDWMILNEETNIPHLLSWVYERKLVGLIDEEKGGIIGYINHAHIEEIVGILNGKEKRLSDDKLTKMYNIIRTCYHVLNAIPNQQLNMIEGKDTYAIASIIGKFLNDGKLDN